MPIIQKWRAHFAKTFFTQAVTTTSSTGIIATPFVTEGGSAVHPLFFVASGAPITGDEVNVITIDWHVDAAGTGGILATTTFDELNAGNLADLEPWPGDITAVYNVARDLVPLFPFHNITWTTGGVAPAPAHTITITIGYLQFDA